MGSISPWEAYPMPVSMPLQVVPDNSYMMPTMTYVNPCEGIYSPQDASPIYEQVYDHQWYSYPESTAPNFSEVIETTEWNLNAVEYVPEQQEDQFIGIQYYSIEDQLKNTDYSRTTSLSPPPTSSATATIHYEQYQRAMTMNTLTVYGKSFYSFN